MSVCGIDFGNLSMLIGHAAKGGVDLILNDASMRQTATCVSFQGKQRFLGDAASAMQRTNVRNTILGMKLLLGRNYDDADVQEEISRYPFQTRKLAHGGVGIVVQYNDQEVVVPVEHLYAVMLTKAQEIGKRANGVAIAECVLAVPNWYTESQRRAIVNACEIADFNCLKIVNESTAIALSYGIYKSAKKLFSETDPVHIMFIDIGYTGYTVTIVDFIQEKLHVRSTICDNSLGGRNFDDVIVQFLVETFKSKTGIDVSSNAKAILKLRAAAEKAKQTLSPNGVTEANVSVECLAEDRDLSCILKKDEFEKRCSTLIAKLRGPIEDCLAEAGLTRTDLSDVEIVGGSSRVNCVKRALGEILGLDASAVNYGLKTTMNSDEAVARGSTLQCAMVSSRIKVKPFSVIDRVYYPVVVQYETPNDSVASSAESKADDEEEEQDEVKASSAGGISTVEIYARGDEYPRKPRRLVFKNKTQSFTISTHYGANANVQTKLLGTHNIRIPDNYLNTPHDIRVTFVMDKNQIVTIQSAELMEEIPTPPAEEKKSESGENVPPTPEEPPKKRFKKVTLTVTTESFGLTRQQIKDCIQTEAEMAYSDRLIVETSDKRNELESYIYAMRSKLDGELKDYATNSEKHQFKELIDKSETWLYDEGFDSTKALYISKLDGLKQYGDPIERRMYEETNRKAACDALKRQIENVRAFTQTTDDAYAHITPEERHTIRVEADNAEQWLYDELEKQGMLSTYNDPVLTVESVEAKRKSLISKTTPTMNKPKPVVKEEKKEDKGEEKKGESKSESKSDAKAEGKDQENESVPMEE